MRLAKTLPPHAWHRSSWGGAGACIALQAASVVVRVLGYDPVEVDPESMWRLAAEDPQVGEGGRVVRCRRLLEL